jgi:hypothetical protein
VHGSISHSGVEEDGTVKYGFRRIRWDRPSDFSKGALCQSNKWKVSPPRSAMQ